LPMLNVKCWRPSEYRAFRKKIAVEVWLINRFADDFGLWDWMTTPSYFPKRVSRWIEMRLASHTRETLFYIIPWIFVMGYKILEAILESSKRRKPVAFSKYPVLHEICQILHDKFRKGRNKIVHTGKYGVSRDHLVVEDERRRVVAKMDVYDVIFFSMFAADLGTVLMTRRLSSGKMGRTYNDIQALDCASLIPKETYQRVKETMKR